MSCFTFFEQLLNHKIQGLATTPLNKRIKVELKNN